ncbi:MAG: SDR family oxidoreductase [Gemmataceae bacterium]|nr:SDR family oxidoreductase [Gemmataceae bacterium]
MDRPMTGKVCLVTGATQGIGAVTAQVLAAQGATVIGVGRNAQKCAAVAQDIRARSGNAAVEFLTADLSVQREIHGLAEKILERCPRLDVLLNNAGAIFFDRRISADGIEMTFALNHLGYFLLTQLLLDRLRASAPARIINVSSFAHTRARMDWNDLQNQQRYAGFQVYCQSKLLNLLFTYEQARRLEGTGVTVNALHPGWVYTGFGGDGTRRGKLFQFFASWFALTPEQGAKTMIYLATSPAVEGVSGKYFVKERDVPSSAASHDAGSAARLWQMSAELTKQPVR